MIKDSDQSIAGCHDTEGEAKDQLAALNIAERSRQDAIDEANYREATADDAEGEICSNCGFNDEGQHCELFSFTFQQDWTCDRWKPKERGRMSKFDEVMQKIGDVLRDIFQVRAWDGSASRWPSTESYCDSCLINLNSAAGNTDREDWTQALCKLPVRNPGSDTNDFEGIQAAAGGRGITRVEKPDDVPQEAFDAAVKKAANEIIASYKKEGEIAPDSVYEKAGKEPPERAVAMGRIWGQVQSQLDHVEGYPWLNDVYRDDDGSLYGVVAKEGKLFRVGLEISGENVTLGEFQQVTEIHQPTSRMVIREQANGKFRWFSVSSTAVLNRVGEIDSSSLYDSFIENAERSGEYPFRDFYHLGEQFKTGQFDFLARDGFVLITSGVYDDSELAKMEIKARMKDPDHWGDSIKFVPTEEAELLSFGDVAIPVYRAGILHSVSTLPEKDAAAWFTSGVVQEVERMLDKRTLGALVDLFDGDEDAAHAWLETNAEGLNRSIEAGGYIKREADTEGETPDVETLVEQELDVELEVDLDESLVEEIVRQMGESEPLVALVQRLDETANKLEALSKRLDVVDELVERVGALEVDEDEKKAAFLSDLPAMPRVKAGFRPRDRRKEVDEEDAPKEPDLSDIPGAY